MVHALVYVICLHQVCISTFLRGRDGIEPRLGSKARRLEAILTRLEKLDARLEIFEPKVARTLRPKECQIGAVLCKID